MTKPLKDISDLYRISLKRVTNCRARYAVTLVIKSNGSYSDRSTMYCFKLKTALNFVESIHDEIGYLCALYYDYPGIVETADYITHKAALSAV